MTGPEVLDCAADKYTPPEGIVVDGWVLKNDLVFEGHSIGKGNVVFEFHHEDYPEDVLIVAFAPERTREDWLLAALAEACVSIRERVCPCN